MTTIELPKQTRSDAIESIKRYFEENMPEPLGDLPAGALLDYFIEEIGAIIYNRAVADAQARMLLRIEDLGAELSAPEFAYWPKVDARRRKRS